MLVNAATGPAKNIVPNRLTATSYTGACQPWLVRR
jgi:hypothetical protein